MPSDLFKPILNDRTRAPNFFNGRLLTGEAMSDEQRAQRVAHELLGHAIGDGVVYGLEVAIATASNTTARPVVTLKSGVAINRRGELLLLAHDTDVQLVRPDEEPENVTQLFRTCTPVSTGTYVANAGVYLLTLSSIRAGNGLAQVSGLGDTPRGCNVKYVVDAVEVRLLELPLSAAILGNQPRLRNAVAYACFGVDDLLDWATDPFATTREPHTLLDDVAALTDCDVPLAVMYWTATGGIQWIDLWSVRRRVTRTRSAAFHPAASDVRRSIGESMALQFREQLAQMLAAGQLAGSATAQTWFRHLPPSGLIPLPALGRAGLDYPTFFSGATTRGPAFVPDADLVPLLSRALDYPPIDLQSAEMFWLYFGVSNMQRANAAGASRAQGFVAFVNGHVEYAANARFDLAYWTFANYARI